MSTEIPVTVPDIGDFEDVDVIEILVAVGDTVGEEDPLITLESDKAAMDIPAPAAGRIAQISVAVGDKVSEGSIIVTIEGLENTKVRTEPAGVEPVADNPVKDPALSAPRTPVTVKVPDIGDFDEVDVIEILVQPGDNIAPEDPLITLESDKATMDIPAPIGGLLEDIFVALGDKVSEGHVIATIVPAPETQAVAEDQIPLEIQVSVQPQSAIEIAEPTPRQIISAPDSSLVPQSSKAYASPSVRKFARELGVDIGAVTGSARKGRIIKSDVQAFVKLALNEPRPSSSPEGFAFLEMPVIDFSKFGPIETTTLTKIKRLTGKNLHRSWVTAPHVTQFDEADISELERFRKSKLEDAAQHDVKLTLLAFLIKAVVVVLHKYPDFNASLSPDGGSIIHKKYFHIGIAVNTDRGLMVPVIKDADKKGLYELAGEISELSTKARNRKLSPTDMQGGSFTISSLGGVGGTYFTPIINLPEVAILGVSPSTTKPVYVNNEFVPRLMLPYALSFDHRVIDGVAGAQFTRHLGLVLGDIRHILL
ncbi:MAG: dihydrolipoyllysine-residue acetyltransferase [Gammaproteobacteria bacterium]